MITIGPIEIVVFLIVCAVLAVFYISVPGGAWPEAVAACALSAMGLGMVYLLLKSRTPEPRGSGPGPPRRFS
jgi:hypothetical protein